MKVPFLLSVPHAGLTVPPEVKDLCRLTEKEISEDGDEGAAAIYYPLQDYFERFVTTHIARAVIDMNRAEDDRRKDGIIKTHTCWDVPVYRSFPTEAIISRLITAYYKPYHQALKKAAPGICLGVDCHTMAAFGPPVGPDPGTERPRICLSNAKGTCPQEWMNILRGCFEEAFKTAVSVNAPFKGGFIIKAHSAEIPWVQIEFSRAAFMGNEEKSRRLLEALQQAERLFRKHAGL